MEQPITDPTGGKKADRKQIHISFVSDEQDSYVSIRVDEFDIQIDSKPFPSPVIKDLGIVMHEHPKSDSSADVAQNRWADLQLNHTERALSSKDDPIIQEFLKSLSEDERAEFSSDYTIYQARLKYAGKEKVQMSDALTSYFERLEKFKQDRDSQSTDINNENVKIKGDLVALRYIVNSDGDSNITDFETHCPLSCQDYDDDALLVYCDEFVENGEWLVFHKNTVHLGMFKIITHDEFNSKLKHLFD